MVEWTTTSAPRASGCCRYGVAKVLSTTRRAPRPWASAATAGDVDDRRACGLDGVSTQTSRVSGRQAAGDGVEVVRARPAVWEIPSGPHTLSISRNVPP